MINPQHQGEGAQAPARRHLAQEAVFPRPPAVAQFGPGLPGQPRGQAGPLLFHGRQQIARPAGAASSSRWRQLCKVCSARSRKFARRSAGRGGPGKLAGEQVFQRGHLAARRQPALGVGQGGQRIDQEDVPRGVLRREHLPPVRADVFLLVGMGLDEDQPGAGGRGGQFLRHPGTAVLLLRGRHQQHVAMRQDAAQGGQVRSRRGLARRTMRCSRGGGRHLVRVFLGAFRRVRIGAIDQHQLGQRRQIALDDLDVAGIDAEHLGRQSGAADERGSRGGGPLRVRCGPPRRRPGR